MFRALTFALILAAAPAAAQATIQAPATQAQANALLRGDPEIWSSLTAMAIAREVARRCPSLDERTFRGRMHAFGLFNRARGLGASRAQIMAFIDDEGEKAHLRREVTAWFAARGLREGSAPAGFCTLGQAEIAARTLAGSFLATR